MANDKRFIARNGLQSQSLLFVDQNSNNAINVSILTNDTLSFSGNTGQLFSITDSLSGVIFAVNDISGIPSIEVVDDGTIRLAETFGNVLIGTAVNGSDKVQIAGDVSISGRITANNIVGVLSGNANTASALQTARTFTIGNTGKTFNGTANVAWSLSEIGVPSTTGTGASGTWAISVTGNANTATALQTARTISLNGDLTGSASFNGSSDVTITTTIAANSVALGADTTGNYVATISGTANEIEVTGSGAETAAVTIGLPDSVTITTDLTVGRNLTITGNLVVTGNTTIINANNLAIEDNMIYLNEGSVITNPDLGIVGNYNDGSYTHTGVFRDATDNRWKFFKRYDPEPDASIDTAHASFVYGDVQANNFYASAFTGALVGNATTATTLQTARTIGDVSFNGSASIVPERTAFKDTRAVDFAPYTYSGTTLHLKTNTTDGLNDGGTYHRILNLQSWSDATGGSVSQLGLTDNNNVYVRSSSNTSAWSAWSKLYDQDDASSATVASKLVLRDSNGSFSTNNINAATLTTSGDLTVNGFTNANDRIILVDSGTWPTGSIDPGADGSLGIYNQHSIGANSSGGSATGVFSLASLYTGSYNHTNASYGDIISVYAYSQGSGNANTYISKAIGVKARIEEGGSGRIQEGIGFESNYYGSIDTFYGFKQNALEWGPANTAYGFYSAIPNASNTYNFYAASTAKNYFAGNIGVGTPAPTFHVQVALSSNTDSRSIGITETNYTSNFKGTYLTHFGANAVGTTYGLNSADLGSLVFQNASAGLIGTNGAPIVLATSSIERVRIDSAGNVGIGSAGPTSKLHVSSAATSSGVVYVLDTAAAAFTAPVGIKLNKAGTLSGHVSPTLEFEVGSGGGQARLYTSRLTGAGGTLIVETDNTSGTSVERMRIDEAGNVSIGGFYNTAASLKVATYDTSNNAISRPFKIEHSTNQIPGNGIGVGLEFITETDNSSAYRVGSSIDSVATDVTLNSEKFDLVFNTMTSGGSATEKMRIASTGNVGIGTISPSYPLQVNGTVAATDFDTLSDRNLKENIVNIPNAIDKVNAINGVYFNFKGDEKKHIGVIAQEVEAVLPEVISVADTGIKSVSYGNLIAVLIEAIKDQQKQIDELKTLIQNK